MEKTPVLGKTEGKSRRRQRMRGLDSITDLVDRSLRKLRGTVEVPAGRTSGNSGFTNSESVRVLGSGPRTSSVTMNYIIFLLRVLVSRFISEGEGSLIGDTQSSKALIDMCQPQLPVCSLFTLTVRGSSLVSLERVWGARGQHISFGLLLAVPLPSQMRPKGKTG